MLGYFCRKFSDPLPATFKVGSCPTVFISAQLFPFYLNIQQNQLVYLSFGLPHVRRIVFLAGITVLLEENLRNKVVSSNSKTELILSRLSSISRFLNIWSLTKIQPVCGSLTKLQTRTHGLGYMCLAAWICLYFNQNAKSA